MLTDDEMPPFQVNQWFYCQPNLVLSCKDTNNTHTARTANNFEIYRIIDGPYEGRFIRADKSEEIK